MATLPLSPSHAKLALQTRKRLVTQVGASLNGLLDKVQERLRDLMDEAAPSRESQLRRDAWMSYQRVKARWVDGTLNAWQAALVAEPKPTGPQSRLGAGL